jgi:TolA-binding protein
MALRPRLLLLLSLFLLCVQASGDTATEKGAFSSAAQAFQDGFYQRAESEMAAFVQQYTNSARLAEAVLIQAQAQMQLTNYTGALGLLSAHFGRAGQWAPEYVFWLGEGYLRMGEPAKAAQEFSNQVRQYPGSARALDASIGEAAARAKLGEWAGVVDLLSKTNGVFQAIARTNHAGELVARGRLLLAEAQFTTGDFSGAQAALQLLADLQLAPRLAWQRQFLLCRLQSTQGNTTEALQGVTNLLVLATNAGMRVFLAESIAFQAGLLERLGQADQAMEAYQKNLGENFPAERQRQALLKIAELSLARNRVPQAAQMLETFCSEHRDASSRDLALLTLGELRLRQHLAGSGTNGAPPVAATTNAPPATNDLQRAMSALETLVKELPQSALIGKAHLNLGWCFWRQEKMPEARAAFQAATERLPVSADKAVAHFKLADCRFRLKDYAGAITNYDAVLEGFGDFAEVKTNLFEPALYQMVRAALEAGNLAVASNGVARILAWYPGGYNTDRAVLIAGQEISRRGNPGGAREILTAFVKAAPKAPLVPEVELAIARTFEQEGNWDEAVTLYDRWTTTFTNSAGPPALAVVAGAQYCRAWANFQAGRQTNALAQFTNFVARFPTHEWTPLAQWWVADYFFRTGRLREAEENFQLLYQSTNWPQSELSYQARMMAGRTAVERRGWKDAIDYFTNLTSDIKCPPDIWLEAMFAYGDALMSRDATNKLADYEEAASVFTRIVESYPTNRMAVLATGQKANCLLQWALFTGNYAPATNELQKVLISPLADSTVRAMARVGLAVVLEKQAEQRPVAERLPLLKSALNYYLDVLYYDKDLREAEQPNLFWVKKAGLEAARLSESLQDWGQAIKIYSRVRDLLPAIAPTLEKRTAKARENLARSR